MDRAARRQALQDFLQFCQQTNRHPLGITVAELPHRLAEYVEDDPYADSALAYQAATETEKAQLHQDFWNYLPALREREARGLYFLRVPFREAGQKGGLPMGAPSFPKAIPCALCGGPGGSSTCGQCRRPVCQNCRRDTFFEVCCRACAEQGKGVRSAQEIDQAQERVRNNEALTEQARQRALALLEQERVRGASRPQQKGALSMEQQQQPLVFVDQRGREHESGLSEEEYLELQRKQAREAAERLQQANERAHQPGFFARLASSLFGQRNTDDGPATVGNGRLLPPVYTDGPTKSTSVMTQEELRVRRMNLVESARHGRPFHESVMLFFLRIWLFVGPIAFVALTTSEVAYILTSLVAPGDNGTYIIWGGALFIDLAMMFTTFGVAIKRRDLAEKREVNGSVSKREEMEVTFGTLMWLIFAIINGISQSAFLLHIISASRNANMNTLYVFVASRVVGFLLGDAVTAFFLAKVDNSALKLIARGEREKAALYRDIAQAEGERQMVEAKAEADILLLQIKVQQEREDAEFLATLKRQVFADILSRRSGPAARSDDSQKGARVLGSGPRS
ncbi:hypothetical protein KSF_030860 [Reticulibacter mediterranei]|uniref:Uncharacterized protein n=1 Tax=Reticulibacter mediterranei TaxID=2778369 RepID=A0A8J3N1Z1_9CHLR|nr:hypothetical protein [Reticulibacter mediterranei]GHO93038.1 hypothetical protein KSF_030860 [Reticulibacter mediterranei]